MGHASTQPATWGSPFLSCCHWQLLPGLRPCRLHHASLPSFCSFCGTCCGAHPWCPMCVQGVGAKSALCARAKKPISAPVPANKTPLVARIPLPPPVPPSDAWVQSYGPKCDPLSWGGAPSRVCLVGAACEPHCWPAQPLHCPQQPPYVWLVGCRRNVRSTTCCFPAAKAGQPQTWHPPCWLPTLVYS